MEYESKLRVLEEEFFLKRGNLVVLKGKSFGIFLFEMLEIGEVVEKDIIEFMEKLEVIKWEKLEFLEKVFGFFE